jgi:hypothetical protein
MAAVVATRTRNLGSIAAAGMVTLWAIEAAAALA